MNKNLLLILTRNPELGKCKTRLAAKVGNENALEIYKFLLQRTVDFTKNLKVEKWVYYSEQIWKNDVWDNSIYGKKLQQGNDLGERMQNAFSDGFKAGYENVIIIGSDMYHLSQADLEDAFEKLTHHDFVVGPAEDGGYYLLGMKSLKDTLFQHKAWGTNTVLKDSLEDISGFKVSLLEEKNDIDYYEDIKDIKVFEPFLKHIKE